MSSWIQKQGKNKFISALSILIAGSAVSNLILISITPLLTRLYTPEEFGVLSVYSAILYMLMIIVSLRYEAAIVLPKKIKDAYTLLYIANISTCIVSITVFVAMYFFPVGTWLDIPMASNYFWLIAISLFFVGIFQNFNNWALRMEAYGVISKSKVVMNSSQGFSQLIFGFLHFGLIGLIMGEVVGRISGALKYIQFYKKDIRMSFKTTRLEAKALAQRYIKFPLVSSISGLLFSAGTNLPTLFLATFFDVQSAGYYYLAQKLLTVPENLIGFSASQVYLTQVAQLVNNGESVRAYCIETIKKLVIITLVIMVVIDLVTPLVFQYIFGDEWGTTATFIQILSIMYFTRIVLQPLNSIFQIYEAFYSQVSAELIRFILIIIAIVTSSIFSVTNVQALWSISILTTVGYIICALLAWQVMRKVGEKQYVTKSET
ncbi:oligosaccharide flippase family protein [Kurthia sibirica]|uniref:Polysaccharide biosynthesis protein n=1 Tax=Kurthia sibirica TaxID=202750 RepID=A0A2U3AJ19_9BACL|nr:oligosaccharide flippase family protein [Kurthia sibirica]PWI24535.1 hypothetical protein DEX24_13160 [Kurthia sibirica]GEK33604.1 lipopolysaccharide biosynthesis protein [Kurthia sibirica]